MSDFLGLMAAASHARVGESRARESLSQLRSRASATRSPPRLERQGRFDVIAEFKRRSPSAGSFNPCDLTAQVTAYARAGAAAVSVLTEPMQFGGDLSHLKTAAEALTPLGIPVMRKDFVVDPYQVYETRADGGGGILLIVRMLPQVQLAELLECAREMSLFVLLETFDEDDLERAESALERARPSRDGAPDLLGVNCRDLRTLGVRTQRLLELAPRLPAGALRVAESGIETALDCAQMARAGFEFALIGSALMQCADPAPIIGQMLAAGRAA
ncbi:MAG TPA: indole-3-glycerol phosphate synthase TrpC [Steroidobacteraceae bacterium]